MKTIVYPTSAAALNIVHPIDGKLKPEGSEWTVDGFTCRMLSDHAVTSNKEEAWQAQALDEEPPPEKASN
jgi:hypothetical protein